MVSNGKIAALLDEGLNFYSEGRFAEARQAWQKARKLDPANADALAYLETIEGVLDEVAEQPEPEEHPGNSAVESRNETPAASPALEDAPEPAIDEEVEAPIAASEPVETAPIDDTPPPAEPPLISTNDDTAAAEEPAAGEPGDVEATVTPMPIAETLPPLPPPIGKKAAPHSSLTVAQKLAIALRSYQDLKFELAFTQFEKITTDHPNEVELWAYYDLVKCRFLDRFFSNPKALESVLKIVISPSMLYKYDLSAESGYLLSLIDGEVTLEDIFSLSGIEDFTTCRIINNLIEQRIVRIEPRG